MTILSPVGFDSTARKHIIANPGDYIDPKYIQIPVTSGTGALASVVGAPTIYTDTTTGDKYYRDTLGVVTKTSHSTSNSTCPATGPTVAPTAEGHYYWTSTLGEKWVWVYGDAAPFVCGNMYSTGGIYAAATAGPADTTLFTFVAPRSGNVIVHFFASTNSASPTITDFFTEILLNGVFLSLQRATKLGAGWNSGETTAMSMFVVQGDVISFLLRNVSTTTALHTTHSVSYTK